MSVRCACGLSLGTFHDIHGNQFIDSFLSKSVYKWSARSIKPAVGDNSSNSVLKFWTAAFFIDTTKDACARKGRGRDLSKGTKGTILTSYPWTQETIVRGCIFEILEFAKGTNISSLKISGSGWPRVYHATIQKNGSISAVGVKLWANFPIDACKIYSYRGKETLTTRAKQAKNL